MSGLGRRTHYRKHVTDSVLNDLPEPGDNESIALVVATRGGNQFDVQLPHQTDRQLAILPTKFRKLVWLKRNDFVIVQTSSSTNTTTTTTDDGEEDGAPAENDETNLVLSKDDTKDAATETESPATISALAAATAAAATPTEETGSIRCMISHILYSDQIKHLRSKGLWPTDDPKFAPAATAAATTIPTSIPPNDGIVYDTGYGMVDSENDDDDDNNNNDADLFVNTNRVSRIAIQDDSSSSEDEEEDD